MATGKSPQEEQQLDIPLRPDWMMVPQVRGELERRILPKYLSSARWFPAHDPSAIAPVITIAIPFDEIGKEGPWLVIFEAVQDGQASRYLLPLKVNWGSTKHPDGHAIAVVCENGNEGTLVDAAADGDFVSLILNHLAGESNKNSVPHLEFRSNKIVEKRNVELLQIIPVKTEQSNSTSVVDNCYVVKIYRKLETGINPEIEMGRFLTDVAHFRNIPALYGSVELIENEEPTALAVVHAFIANQGDAWSVSEACIDRLVQTLDVSNIAQAWQSYCQHIDQAGKRVGEMHVALSSRTDIAEFRPEPISTPDVVQWTEDILRRASRIARDLKKIATRLEGEDLRAIEEVLIKIPSLEDHLAQLMSQSNSGVKIRHHGDLHLGQMLVTENDIYIIDFEGEPSRPLTERRRKAPAARDVAGVVRSIDYSFMSALQRRIPREEREHLRPVLNEWRDQATKVFLAAYQQAIGNAASWPENAPALEMLDYFLLEKAIYEIEYELAYRPSWLSVPLGSVNRILGHVRK